jgi:hypothetical protein
MGGDFTVIGSLRHLTRMMLEEQMNEPHDCGRTQLNRRKVMRLLGIGAGLGITRLASKADLCAGSFQQSDTPMFLPGAIIRTVLGDTDPASIKGITLHHEHLGNGLPQPGKKARRPTEDVDWMTEEMIGIKTTYNVGCIVSALTGFADAETRDYLKVLSQRTGIHFVLSNGYYLELRYPPRTKTQSEDQIADQLVEMAKEFGMGVNGEIGVSKNAAISLRLRRRSFVGCASDPGTGMLRHDRG